MDRKKLRVITVIALVVCLAVGFVYWRSVDQYVFEESGFYPANGMKYSVSVGDTAEMGDDERYAVLNLGELDAINGEEACVYVDDRDAIILTSAMSIMPKPLDGKISLYRLSAFTDVQRNISNLLISSKTHKYIGDAVLLFNGVDTYIVLDSATLKYGDKTVTLSPLSYIVACRDQWVQYYDYSRDKYSFDYINQGCSVEIRMNNRDIIIEADKDRGSYEGEEFMFFTSVTYLDDFFDYYY